MLRYGQFGIRRLSQSQVLSAKKLQYLIDNQWKGKDPKYARKISSLEKNVTLRKMTFIRVKIRQKVGILSVPWKDSAATEWIEVRNPATQEVVSLVPVQPLSEMEAVAESSQKAFQSWKNTSILSRQQIMLKYQELIKEHKTEIAKLITLEQGYDVILTW